MSIKQRVEKDLKTLQAELEKLSSYTQEIEKSKMSSEKSAKNIKALGKVVLDIAQLQEKESADISKSREKIEKLTKKLDITHEKIASVDFPNRLDKIDTQISTINLNIHTIQDRINTVEKSITNQVASLSKEMSSYKQDLKLKIGKVFLLLTIIIMFLIIGFVLVIVLSKNV